MSYLSVRLFGSLQVTVAGEVVTRFESDKARALLAYLVAEPERPHRREKLAGLLWPDLPESSAHGRLRRVLANLRHVIGDSKATPPFLHISREAIQFNRVSDAWVDVTRFADLMGATDPKQPSIGQLEEAVALYRGPFLEGFSLAGSAAFEEWLLLQQEWFRRQALTALRQLAFTHEGRRGYLRALEFAWRRVNLEPWEEEAHQQVMRLLAYTGRRGAALAQYKSCRRVLAEELGAEPGAETTRLYEQIRAGQLETPPPVLPAAPQQQPRVRLTDFLEGEKEPQRPAFVARELELAQLQRSLDAALAGQGQVVFVSGDAGSGKSSLLIEFGLRAMTAHPDLLSAWGSCSSYCGVGDPYLPFREALGTLTGDVQARWAAGGISSEHARRLWHALPLTIQALLNCGPHLLNTFLPGPALLSRAAAVASSDAPWLERLQEAIAAAAQERVGPEGLAQSHLFEQYTNVLRELAAACPLLLVLDDLQWADVSSCALIFHIGRRLKGNRILIACAYRPDEVRSGRPGASPGERERHPLEKVLAEFKGQAGDVRIDLDAAGTLRGQRFVESLLDTEPNCLGSDFRSALFDRTGGHALFTVELLRAMQERGDLLRDQAGRWVLGRASDWRSLPARVEGVIEERLGRLPEELRAALTVASVEGEQFTAEVVAQVRAMDARDLVRRLSEDLQKEHRLVSARGLRRLEARRLALYRFQHNLFQEYLYSGIDPLERAYLHEDVGNVLEALYGGQSDEVAVQLARHFMEAGVADKAVRYLRRSGELATARYANAEAERHFRAALEVAGDGPDRAELLAKLGVVQALQSRFEEALASWRLGIQVYAAAGDRDGVASLYAYAGRAAWDRGDTAGGLAMCREGMAAVTRMGPEPSATAGMARLLHETARACLFNGLPEEAASLGRQALDLAERLGAVELQAESLTTLALLPGQAPQEAVALLGRAIALAEAAGLLPQTQRAEHNLANLYSDRLGDLDSARAHFLRAAELGRQMGDVSRQLLARVGAARVALIQGMLVTTEQELPALWQLEATAPDPGTAVVWLSWLEAGVLYHGGRLTEAARRLQALRAEWAAAGDLQGLVFLADSLAEVQFEMAEAGAGEAAGREAIRASEQFRGESISPTSRLSAWHAGRGDLEQARSLLSQAREEAAARWVGPWEATWLSRAEANLAAAEGRWSAALAAFEGVTGECRRMGARWYAAWFMREWAEAFLARGEPGDREQARSLLAQVAAEFDVMGAPFYAEQAKRRMNELAHP